jgi:uncharacterized protein GlcG (DUF336 family)
MFNYFPDAWSSTVAMGLMAEGQLGEMHRWLEPLLDAEPDMDVWDAAWFPIKVNGEIVGAIGLGGAPTVQNDVDCATAALAFVPDVS